MKIKIAVLSVLCISPLLLWGQDKLGNFSQAEADDSVKGLTQAKLDEKVVKLEDCYLWAEQNYPLIRQYDLIEQSNEYTLSNIAKSYLPQFALNSQATYQTEVTKIPIDFEALNLPIYIKNLNKDQYKFTAEASQIIWDGGNIASQKNVVKANTEVQKQQNKVQIYQIKDRINQLYFGILGTDAQLKLLNLLQEDLEANKKVMTSMYNNGVITQSDIDAIDVQLINVEQNRIEQEAYRRAYIQMLALFVNQNLDMNNVFILPSTTSQNLAVNRPELQLFENQRDLYENQLKTVDAKNMPQIGAFIQGGYANPALNMLDNKFQFYAIGGVKLSWDFGNFYTKKNEKRKLQIEKESVNVQEQTFLFNIRQQMTQQNNEIVKTKKIMDKDDEIIQLRDRIKLASESKYKNGAYLVNDLIQDINAANQARQKKYIREIQYIQQQYNRNFTQGF